MISIRIASAPVSFGVDEVQSDAWRPTADSVVREIAGLGLEGTELGPPGFLGSPRETRLLLETNGLALVGAYFPLRFSRAGGFGDDLAWLRSALADLRDRSPAGSTPKAIIADDFSEPDRLALAGAIDRHPETWLPADRQELLVANIHRAAELCQRMGFDAVVHPHAGTYIETEREIRWVAERLDPTMVGLCLDTGHIRFGGARPAEIARDFGHLVRHVHAKDCDPRVRQRVARDELGLKRGLEEGVFCELGAGDARFDHVAAVLAEIGYSGWIVLEQDRRVARGTKLEELTASVRRNADYVRSFLGHDVGRA